MEIQDQRLLLDQDRCNPHYSPLIFLHKTALHNLCTRNSAVKQNTKDQSALRTFQPYLQCPQFSPLSSGGQAAAVVPPSPLTCCAAVLSIGSLATSSTMQPLLKLVNGGFVGHHDHLPLLHKSGSLPPLDLCHSYILHIVNCWETHNCPFHIIGIRCLKILKHSVTHNVRNSNAVAQLVVALRYKPEGRGFDSQ
jgi:hypothetical protein